MCLAVVAGGGVCVARSEASLGQAPAAEEGAQGGDAREVEEHRKSACNDHRIDKHMAAYAATHSEMAKAL